ACRRLGQLFRRHAGRHSIDAAAERADDAAARVLGTATDLRRRIAAAHAALWPHAAAQGVSVTATIRSVAELAGVSTATVSRALAQPDKVSKATRERVLEAVRATGFVPNRQAVDFRRKETGNVILLVRDIS